MHPQAFAGLNIRARRLSVAWAHTSNEIFLDATVRPLVNWDGLHTRLSSVLYQCAGPDGGGLRSPYERSQCPVLNKVYTF